LANGLWELFLSIHLIYNALVFIPMVVAMYYHVYPPVRDAMKMTCTCAHQRAPVSKAA